MRTFFIIIPLLLFAGSCTYLPEEYDDLNFIVTETPDYIEMRKQEFNSSSVHIVFYPGGLVDPHAYVEALEKLLPFVFRIVIIKHDGNLAVLDQNKAEDFIIDAPFPFASTNIIMGHSLGGAMACSYVSNNENDFDGVILLGAYPTENFSLADYNGSVLSITGSMDGVLDLEKHEEGKAFLPPGETINSLTDFPSSLDENTTIYFDIEGGNHAQFGSYGEQNGDGEASISSDEQQEQVKAVIVEFLNAKGWM